MKHLHFDVEPSGFYGAYWDSRQQENIRRNTAGPG